MKKLLVVVGTRPNFVKVTRFKEVAARRGDVQVEIVHTGQHADHAMTTVFFEQFGMRPDHWLDIRTDASIDRMGHISSALGPIVRSSGPDAMVVVGDVDSTLAAANTAHELGVPLVHLESGLRNHDKSLPEEVNRVRIDRITDHFLVTEPSGRQNLLKEGADPTAIHLVGNTMIDTLVAFADRIERDPVLDRMGLGEGGHVLMTIHRQATVDDPVQLDRLVDLIGTISPRHRVVFPMHPRTANNMERMGRSARLHALPGLHICGPLEYFAFQRLLSTSAFVLTDSGGVQEETTYRGIPCLTLRPNTERPVTVEEGTNELMPFDLATLQYAIHRIENGTFKKGRVPDLWDGHATERIFDALIPVL